MEKQYRYLINNEVLGSDKPYQEPCYQTLTDLEGDEYLDDWNDSKVKLECREVELDKINYEVRLDFRVTKSDLFLSQYLSNPIDITSITTVKDGKVYFKEVESESNEAIEFAEWILNKAFNKNKGIWNNNITKGALTTKELYEIFKNK